MRGLTVAGIREELVVAVLHVLLGAASGKQRARSQPVPRWFWEPGAAGAALISSEVGRSEPSPAQPAAAGTSRGRRRPWGLLQGRLSALSAGFSWMRGGEAVFVLPALSL